VTIQLPGFLEIGWVKGLITVVFVQAIINAIFTFNPLILLGVLLVEASILTAVYVVLKLKSRQKAPLIGKRPSGPDGWKRPIMQVVYKRREGHAERFLIIVFLYSVFEHRPEKRPPQPAANCLKSMLEECDFIDICEILS